MSRITISAPPVSRAVSEAHHLVVRAFASFVLDLKERLDALSAEEYARIEAEAVKDDLSDEHKVPTNLIPFSTYARCEWQAFKKMEAIRRLQVENPHRSGAGRWGGQELAQFRQKRKRGTVFNYFVRLHLDEFLEKHPELERIDWERSCVLTFKSKNSRVVGFTSTIDFVLLFRDGVEIGFEIKDKGRSLEFGGKSWIWVHDYLTLKYYTLFFDEVFVLNVRPSNRHFSRLVLSDEKREALLQKLADVVERFDEESYLKPALHYCDYCDLGRARKCPIKALRDRYGTKKLSEVVKAGKLIFEFVHHLEEQPELVERLVEVEAVEEVALEEIALGG
ncbi:hypothetical protein [Thermococcus sp. MAR1]|uniref:hypothetical protein n=1 Tax=Thermococcus sp. MAR1 TaxID=1638263 RepID=UPI001438EDAE|nr:hypothetical protein [Thermococcus sp. MAR1]NJE09328.1 hypothetical protein [Thermococcus sp. MAR1]